MKYYNIELSPAAAERMQQFLYNLAVKFEASAAGPMIHFEILLSPESMEYKAINKFIEEGAILCI